MTLNPGFLTEKLLSHENHTLVSEPLEGLVKKKPATIVSPRIVTDLTELIQPGFRTELSGYQMARSRSHPLNPVFSGDLR